MKKILLAALWLPLTALAQSYPSPHFNNVTIDGTLTASTPTFTNPVPVTSGGTGAATASGARTNLSAAASGANSDITSLTGLTTPLSTAQGGTGTGSMTQYNVAVGGSGAMSYVGPGNSGYVLTSSGATSYPSFQAIPWGVPGAIGSGTPNSGAFTTLSASIANPNFTYNQGGTNAVNRSYTARLQDYVSVFDEGAACNGSTSDATAFASNVPAMAIPAGSGDCVIASNTTVTADLIFRGGVITVNSGVTLTINGDIFAPHKVIFQGAGTVVINRGIIDVAWFDGTDASTKTAFALRGVSNTNGTGKELAYYTPQPGDAWATTSPNNQWGQCWNVTAPIDLEQAQAYTMYLTYSCFDATVSMDSVFLLGNGTNKADGQNFPLRVKVDGGNGLASWAMRVRGASHLFINYLEAYYCGGIAFTPNGTKQVSDVQVNFIDTGALYNQAVLMDGSNGASNTITDVEIGFVNSTGFANGHAADSVVRVGSNTNGITIRKVAHRAVSGTFVDATTAVVLIGNAGGVGSTLVSPRYGIKIGPVLNGSTTQTAESVVVADSSSGAAAKMTGITIEAGTENDTGSPPGSADISLNYTSGAIVQGLPMASSTNSARKVTVNSTCIDTKIYGVNPSQVVDGGTGTLIDGHNYGAISAVTFTSWPFTYTNNNNFTVEFQVQGASTLTTVNYTRNGTTVGLAFSGTQGSWLVSPGDNVAINGTGTPTLHIIPR